MNTKNNIYKHMIDKRFTSWDLYAGYFPQLFVQIIFRLIWWHVSAARYDITIVMILENFHENSKF